MTPEELAQAAAARHYLNSIGALPRIRRERDRTVRVMPDGEEEVIAYQTPAVRNVTAALPEFIAAPYNRIASAPGFIGDAARYLSQPAESLTDENVEAVQTFGERAADALPFGFGDEIASVAVSPFVENPNFRQEYLEERSARTARSPIASLGGTIAGIIPTALIAGGNPRNAAAVAEAAGPALSTGARLLSAGRNIGAAALRNAGIGAVQGAGLTESDDLADRSRNALSGGLIGGALGAAGEAVSEGVGAGRAFLQARRNAAMLAAQRMSGAQAEIVHGPAQGSTIRSLLAPDDVMAAPPPLPHTAPPPLTSAASATDEFAQVADDALLPRTRAPQLPSQGPALRQAALRGERSFGAVGERGADPSIQIADELTGMSRDFADIEAGSGGFQPLKDRRIAQAMAENPPDARVWAPRVIDQINAIRGQLESITRRAGATTGVARNVGEALFQLDEAERLFASSRSPVEIYRLINRANMSIGRAASREAANNSAMGMQHTTAFYEPLERAYQSTRQFLTNPETWGQAVAAVQTEMNSSIAPLLRNARALSGRVGRLFQDSGDEGAAAFRTYQEVRPEAVRGVLSRVADDAYESERRMLRAWIENYNEQGQTLQRLADIPELATQAQSMSARASRLLDLLNRAETEGRAAAMLNSVADLNALSLPGLPKLSVGAVVRTLARIENGEIPVTFAQTLERLLQKTEQAISSSATPLLAQGASALESLSQSAAPPSTITPEAGGSRYGDDYVFDENDPFNLGMTEEPLSPEPTDVDSAPAVAPAPRRQSYEDDDYVFDENDPFGLGIH